MNTVCVNLVTGVNMFFTQFLHFQYMQCALHCIAERFSGSPPCAVCAVTPSSGCEGASSLLAGLT